MFDSITVLLEEGSLLTSLCTCHLVSVISTFSVSMNVDATKVGAGYRFKKNYGRPTITTTSTPQVVQILKQYLI